MKNIHKPGLPQFFMDLINRLETYNISPLNYIAVFLSISFFRNFLEGAMEITRTIGTGATQETTILQMGVLFNLEWMTLFAALVLAIQAFTKVNPASLAKLMLFCFIWIIIVPFFDFFIYYPSGCKIDYLYTFQDYMRALLFFFMPYADIKVCAGIRLEVFAAFMFCWAYVFIKTKSALKSLITAVILYFLAVSSMAYPVFILLPAMPFSHDYNALVNRFFFGDSYGGEFLRRNSVMIFLLLTPLLFILYRIQYGYKKFMEILKRFFSPPALLFASAFFCGFMLAPERSETALFSNPFDFFLLFSGCLTCLIFGLYLRELKEKVQKTDFKPFYIILILISSMAVSFSCFLFYIFIFAIMFFYYYPPFNLNMTLFFHNLELPLYATILFLCGFSVIAGPGLPSRIHIFLPLLIFACIFFASLSSSYPKNSIIISLMFFFIVLVPACVSSMALLIPAIICAALSVYFLGFFKSQELRYDYICLLFAVTLVLTGILGR